MKKIILLLLLFLIWEQTNAASFGWAVPVGVLQESTVLHVHFDSNVPRSGLPECATRTYIDLTTEAGRVRASLAIAAFAAGKEVFFYIEDGLTSCGWSSSVPNRWLSVRR